jgi:hypothetical protein
VTGIDDFTFDGCYGITSIVFVNVTSLGVEWANGCVNLDSVTISSEEYTTTDIYGWNNVGPAVCTLYAPTQGAADTFKANIIGAAYADKWTVVLPT